MKTTEAIREWLESFDSIIDSTVCKSYCCEAGSVSPARLCARVGTAALSAAHLGSVKWTERSVTSIINASTAICQAQSPRDVCS